MTAQAMNIGALKRWSQQSGGPQTKRIALRVIGNLKGSTDATG